MFVSSLREESKEWARMGQLEGDGERAVLALEVKSRVTTRVSSFIA